MGLKLATTACSAILLLATPLGFAQNIDEILELRQEIEALKRGQRTIQEDVKAIRDILERAMRPRQASVPIEHVQLILSGLDDDPIKGGANAELMLIEFSDYQCPFCRRHFMTTLPQLERDYVASGKIKYVFRDFPIESDHPYAFGAAQAAHCAGEQGQYWRMHDRLFQNADLLGPGQLPRNAEAIGLDATAFTECLESEKYADEVRQDIVDGNSAGVTATPTFFLALEGDEPGTAQTLMKIRGAQSYAVFRAAIDSALGTLDRRAR